MQKDPEVRKIALEMAASKRRPRAIRKAQMWAWRRVLKARANLLKAGAVMDQAMSAASAMMKDTIKWERADRKLREKFIAKCERVRHRNSQRELATVKRIRLRMEAKLLQQAERVPVLQREMLQPR
jgi:hypothetical protein